MHADLLGRSLRDLRLIMQRADDGQAQPRPRRAEAAGQGDDAEQDAHARQDRERGARRDGALHARGVDADGKTRAVRAHEENDAHHRNERDDAAADRVHGYAVELGQDVVHRRFSSPADAGLYMERPAWQRHAGFSQLIARRRPARTRPGGCWMRSGRTETAECPRWPPA